MADFRLSESAFLALADRMRDKPQPVEEKTILLAYRLLVAGESVASVAETEGVTTSRVYRIIERFKAEAELDPREYVQSRIAGVLNAPCVPASLRQAILKALAPVLK